MKLLAIGAGKWGQNIVRTLHGLEVLGGILDGSEATRAAMNATYPEIPTYRDVAEALANRQFDAVTIATPAETHAAVAAQCIEAGLHAFVEKPLTLNSTDADRLCALAKEHDRVLMVGHLLLYQPAVQYLRRAISEGLIGDLVSIHQERLNLGRARAVENVLWSLGVHDVAVAMFLADSVPTSVTGSGLATLTDGIDDDFYLHVRFDSGVQSHLHCSWLWPELRRQTIVIGTEGMLTYNELEQAAVLSRKRIDANLQNVDEGQEEVFRGAGEPLKLELEHFLDCCQNGTRPNSDGDSAAQVVRILEQASPTAPRSVVTQG